MQWLSGWLKELILLILIATFADLILPNNSLQRYVKTVIGLFLILVLLSPVVRLLQNQWDANRMMRAAEALQTESGRRGIPSLESIAREAEKLAASNERQAVAILETRLAEEVKKDLIENTTERVESVQITAGQDSEGKLTIERMNIVLALVKPKDESSKDAIPAAGGRKIDIEPVRPIEPVEPVKPVIIGRDSPPEAEGATGTSGGGRSAELESRRETVIRYLHTQWQIGPGQIHLTFGGRPEGTNGNRTKG